MLEFEKVSKYYGKKAVLKNVSFSVKRGEIFGILGQSGAGKSTIGKLLLQMIKTTEGKILFEGKELKELSRREIQTVFQDPYSSLNPSLKIGQILEEPLLANGVKRKEERRKKVLETLKKVGLLESDAEKYPSELSGGQRQRVCIAGAIILSPKLIVCDEPIASLDLAIQEQILQLIYRIADRILLLYQGEVQEIQNTLDFFYHPNSEYGRQFLQNTKARENSLTKKAV